MDGELSAYTDIKAAIVNYAGYTTIWNKTVFDVQTFDDIPNGTMHNGYCPFVAFKGGTTDNFTQVVGDMYSGEMDFELGVFLADPLISGSAQWNKMKTFMGELERAVSTLDGNGFTMSPGSSRSEPESLNQMIKREMVFSCQFTECRAPEVVPVDPPSLDFSNPANSFNLSLF